MAEALRRLADHAGILPGYTDMTGTWRETSDEARAALLSAMGLPATEGGAADWLGGPAETMIPSWRVVEADAFPGIVPPEEWRLTLDDGTEIEGRGPLPALPMGRHRLEGGGETCWLLCAPPRLPLPPRGWGLIVPLYGLRPAETGGVGTYEDLATLAASVAEHGAGFVGLNPVHAGFPTDPHAASPYTPSHRRRLSTLHIATGRSMPPGAQLIDYAAEIPAQNAALADAFEAFEAAGPAPAFEAWVAAEGEKLSRFALHQALSDRHGPYWCEWPESLKDPHSPDAARASRELRQSIRRHAWSQWMAEEQLRAAQVRAREAGMAHGLYLDLAVGTHPHGAETWEDRSSFAFGASLGAPPDAFSSDGQNWRLAPFNPRALIETGFQPLAETLAQQFSFSGLLRVDHILGFERAFWVPDGAPGAYVQMPREAMLAVARIEAARAGATIVGEDLGNIPEGLGHALDESGILGCRLTMFERDPGDPTLARAPCDYPEGVIASFSTHDLPTWRGWRAGREIDTRQTLGHLEADAAEAARTTRAAEVAALDRSTARCSDRAPEDAARMHAHLAGTRARLVAVQVENVLAIEPQPNLPGTVTEYPNWRQRLPLPPETLAQDPRVAETARIMTENGR